MLLALLIACYAPPEFLPERPDQIPLLPEGVCAPSREAFVACTLDGDTFDVGLCGDEQGERVRLLGIDAPEIAHGSDPADCWGDEAAFELQQLIEGRQIVLSFDWSCVDIYGRTLAYAWLVDDETDADDVLLNEWLLAQGHARRFDEPGLEGDLRLLQRLIEAEATAQTRGVGLWGQCSPS